MGLRWWVRNPLSLRLALRAFRLEGALLLGLRAGTVSPWGEEGSELHGAGDGGASEPGYGAFFEAEPSAVRGAGGEEGYGVAHPGFVAYAGCVVSL